MSEDETGADAEAENGSVDHEETHQAPLSIGLVQAGRREARSLGQAISRWTGCGSSPGRLGSAGKWGISLIAKGVGKSNGKTRRKAQGLGSVRRNRPSDRTSRLRHS